MRVAQEGDLNAQWQRRCGYTLRFLRERLSTIRRDFSLDIQQYFPEQWDDIYSQTLAEPRVIVSYEALAGTLEVCLSCAVKLGKAFVEKDEKHIKLYFFELRGLLNPIFVSRPNVIGAFASTVSYLDAVEDAIDSFSLQSVCCFGIFTVRRDKEDVDCVEKLSSSLKKRSVSGDADVTAIAKILSEFDKKTALRATVFRNILVEKKLLKNVPLVSEKQLLMLPLIECDL